MPSFDSPVGRVVVWKRYSYLPAILLLVFCLKSIAQLGWRFFLEAVSVVQGCCDKAIVFATTSPAKSFDMVVSYGDRTLEPRGPS